MTDQKELDALNKALEYWEREDCIANTLDAQIIHNAAQAYAALLKHADEIGALVKIINTALQEADSTTAIDMALLRQVIDTRPTLQTIHDNLTKWGE
jgi:hypothetical protein